MIRLEKVYFIGAGPGDPDLITVKGLALLKEADVLVYTGSLVNPELVERSGASVIRDSHGMHLADIVTLLEGYARAGKKVVRLHSGDPSLYGAIVEQIQELDRRGVPVEIVPGVSSMFAAAAALGIQLTLGGVSESVIVTRPAGETLERDDIPGLSAHRTTMVIFLGSAHLAEITARLACPRETPAAVVYHASWPDQVILKGTVADIANKAQEAGINRSALLIVGDVLDPAGRGHHSSHLYA